MPGLIDLRRRIRTVGSTRQITRAMKMVAAARLRRSQDRILSARPYASELKAMVSHLAAQADTSHPLLQKREEGKVLLVTITSDKGLCASFNANIIRRAQQELRRLPSCELLLVGRRGIDFFKRRPVQIQATHRSSTSDGASELSRELATDLASAFTSREYDAVYVLYNQFVSVLQQKLTLERLLPLETADDVGGEVGGRQDAAAQRDTPQQDAGSGDFLFEPSAADILGDIVPRYVHTQVRRILLDSEAAENAARMTAMDAATKNAEELIDRLTLEYNQRRQAAITRELIEVVSGAKALEG